MAKRALKAVIASAPLKLDLGCGTRKIEGFKGVDRKRFEGVDIVQDLLKPWQWKADSVAEIHMSHALEHFSGIERIFIFNEMYRVLQMGAKALIVTPHWCSNRAYGDPTHKWPPVSEMAFNYLNKIWRKDNAPDTDEQWMEGGYNCDFQATGSYIMHPSIIPRSQEYQGLAMGFFKEAAQDIITTLVKV